MTNKRTTFIIVALLLLCISSAAQEKVSYQRDYRFLVERIDGIYIPKDINEAIDSLDMMLSIEDKRYIADSLSLDDFRALCHHNLGMWIRNNWGLWGGSRLQRYFVDKKVYHPDDMSDEIMKAYYKKKIQGLDYSVEDDIAPNPSKVKVKKASSRGRLRLILKHIMSKDYRKTKREFKEGGCVKGGILYFQYPYGCSTAEEQQIWFEAENYDLLPKGEITDIDYDSKRMKIKLLSTISKYGIIVYDADLEDEKFGDIEKDFDHFVINSPNRFYMQKGDELWFDVESGFWDTGEQ